jgi:hypothetical protein
VSAGNPGWRFMVEGMVGMMVSDFDNKGTKSDFAHLFSCDGGLVVRF